MKKKLLIGSMLILSSTLVACGGNEVQPTPTPTPEVDTKPTLPIKPTEERPSNPAIKFITAGRYTEYITNLNTEERKIEITVPFSDVYLTDIEFEINYNGQISQSYFINDERVEPSVILTRGLTEIKIKLKAKYNEEIWTVVFNNTTPDVIDIELIDYDSRIPFYVGDDLSRLKLKVVVNGEESIVPVSEDMITGFNTKKPTTVYTEFKITYLGQTITRGYNVHERPIHISTADIKKTYVVGDERLEGAILYSTNSYANTRFIFNADDVEGFDTSTPGEKTVKIRFMQELLEVKITVYEATSSVEVTSFKDVYFKNSSFINGRLRVRKNGRIEYVDLTSDMVTGLDLSKEGLQEATIKYNDTEIKRNVLVLPEVDKDLSLGEPEVLEVEGVKNLLASIKALNSIKGKSITKEEFNDLVLKLKEGILDSEVEELSLILSRSAISNKNIASLISYINSDALVLNKYINSEGVLKSLKAATKDELNLMKGSLNRLMEILTPDQWASLILVQNKLEAIDKGEEATIYDKETRTLVSKTIEEVLKLLSLDGYEASFGGEFIANISVSEAKGIIASAKEVSLFLDTLDSNKLYNLLHLNDCGIEDALEAIHMLGNIIEESFSSTALNDAIINSIAYAMNLKSYGDEDKLINSILVNNRLTYFNRNASKISEMLMGLDIYTLDSLIYVLENGSRLSDADLELKNNFHVVAVYFSNYSSMLDNNVIYDILDSFIPNSKYYICNLHKYADANYLDLDYKGVEYSVFERTNNDLIFISAPYQLADKIKEKYPAEGIYYENSADEYKPGFGYKTIHKDGYKDQYVPYYIYDKANAFIANDSSYFNLLKDYVFINYNGLLVYGEMDDLMDDFDIIKYTSDTSSILNDIMVKIYLPELNRVMEVRLGDIGYTTKLIKQSASDINPSILRVMTSYGDIDLLINLMDTSYDFITGAKVIDYNGYIIQDNRAYVYILFNYGVNTKMIELNPEKYDLHTLGRRTIHVNEDGYEFDLKIEVITRDYAYSITKIISATNGVNPDRLLDALLSPNIYYETETIIGTGRESGAGLKKNIATKYGIDYRNISINASLEKIDEEIGNATLVFSTMDGELTSYTFKVNLITEYEALRPVIKNISGEKSSKIYASFEKMASLDDEKLAMYLADEINKIRVSFNTNYSSDSGFGMLRILEARGYKYSINVARADALITLEILVDGEAIYTILVEDLETAFYPNAGVDIDYYFSYYLDKLTPNHFDDEGNLKPRYLKKAIKNLEISFYYKDFRQEFKGNEALEALKRNGYSLAFKYMSEDNSIKIIVVNEAGKEYSRIVNDVDYNEALIINVNSFDFYKGLTLDGIKDLVLTEKIFDATDQTLLIEAVNSIVIVNEERVGDVITYNIKATLDGYDYYYQIPITLVTDLKEYSFYASGYGYYVEDINNIDPKKLLNALNFEKHTPSESGGYYVNSIYDKGSLIDDLIVTHTNDGNDVIINYSTADNSLNKKVSVYVASEHNPNYWVDIYGDFDYNEGQYYDRYISRRPDEVGLSYTEIFKGRVRNINIEDRTTGNVSIYSRIGIGLSLDEIFKQMTFKEENGILTISFGSFSREYGLGTPKKEETYDPYKLDKIKIIMNDDPLEAIPTKEGMINQVEEISFHIASGPLYYMNSKADIVKFLSKYGSWETTGLESTITVSYKGVATKFSAKSYLA